MEGPTLEFVLEKGEMLLEEEEEEEDTEVEEKLGEEKLEEEEEKLEEEEEKLEEEETLVGDAKLQKHCEKPSDADDEDTAVCDSSVDNNGRAIEHP